jgi:hypothetical protein
MNHRPDDFCFVDQDGCQHERCLRARDGNRTCRDGHPLDENGLCDICDDVLNCLKSAMEIIRLDDGTVISSQLLESVWEMERRGYLFRWSDRGGLFLELADWHSNTDAITTNMENPLLYEPGWEPIFVLDHIDEVAVLVQYQAHRSIPLQ